MQHLFAQSLAAVAALASIAVASQSAVAPRAAAASCSPTSTASYARSPGIAVGVGSPASYTDTIVVSGLDPYLWDVDVTVNLTHTAGNDIDILIASPAGTQIVLTSNNGGSNDNTFAGTLFDGQANDPPTEHAYAMNVVATPLSPEGSFGAFRGENPNGTWTMTIRDELAGDSGTWNSWGLDLYTLPSAPVEITATVSESPAVAIPSPGSVSRTLNVSGLGSTLTKLVLYTEIVHTYNADIDMTLTSPAGTQVIVTTDNGFTYDNGFNGTTWDPDGVAAVTDHFFPGNGVQTPLTPEGPFTAFMGQNPNGVWTLTVADDRTNDLGTLARWDLTISTCPGVAPIVYCTPAGPTAGGCMADIAATDSPNVSHSNTCQITISNVDDHRSGILFYSLTGSQSTPWCAAGGNSSLCVLFPTIRTPVQDSGGGVSACDGAFFLDWNAFQIANPGFPGQPFGVGDKAWVQGWFRSTADCKTTFLSEAVEITYGP